MDIGAREYEPSTGRFLAADPVLDSADPQSLNGYDYADNNPIGRSDPTGLHQACDGPCSGAANPGAGSRPRGMPASTRQSSSTAGCQSDSQCSRNDGNVSVGPNLTTISLLGSNSSGFGACDPSIGCNDPWYHPDQDTVTIVMLVLSFLSLGPEVAGEAIDADEATAQFLKDGGADAAGGAAGSELLVPSEARFIAGANGTITDLVVADEDVVSLGKYPAYIKQAQANGERVFWISDDDWANMSTEEQTIRNEKFLAKEVQKNSVFHLASNPWNEATGAYANELDYLRAKGYTPTPDGHYLVRTNWERQLKIANGDCSSPTC